MEKKHIARFLEFLIVGIALGIAEDLLAIKVLTGADITLNMVKTVFFIALPFAVFSELIVDGIDFVRFFGWQVKEERAKIKEDLKKIERFGKLK